MSDKQVIQDALAKRIKIARLRAAFVREFKRGWKNPTREAKLLKQDVPYLKRNWKAMPAKTRKEFVTALIGSASGAASRTTLPYAAAASAGAGAHALATRKKTAGVKCKKCGGTERDTRMGVCDKCAFPSKTKNNYRPMPVGKERAKLTATERFALSRNLMKRPQVSKAEGVKYYLLGRSRKKS